MLLSSLLTIPLIGTILVSSLDSYKNTSIKSIALITSIINLILSLIIFILFNSSTNQFQYIQEHYNVQLFDIYLGIDGISIYFILLTTIIMPIALLSNWDSIKENVKSYLIIMLLLETLLLAVFMALDVMLFYIFFESILPPLFILIGIFGSDNKVNASYYLFLYTLWGSLFLLLSILSTSSIMGSTDFDTLFKLNFEYTTQVFLFIGIFIAFAVKTPTIFLNNWLLKAHVESPLGGSIVLAAIVLKLSLYGIFRLILPILPKASLDYTFVVYTIAVITIIYASFSTLRTTDIKELIAYSSVCHAAVYLIGAFSNTIQGLEGSIILGLAHGFVSSGLFICAGGVLYDRTGTRSIFFYRGVAQLMPIFAILFFILALGNCGAPLTLNFIGEFMSLYGIIERLPVLGVFACSSIVFSAAYTIYMFNRTAFGGSFTRFLEESVYDVNKREFILLFILVAFTIILGIYPSIILNVLGYSMNNLIYSV
uniref:NADH-ubiquinone oxidoreductase chain 4 n=1 Tax=Cordyceps militaris TaxID=73501 RepID=A0A0G3Y630_CORMI|nr:NADH dehydrogenase subunit 4 [Cordyceps militaris]AOR87410.1 NADH dehydrogenase subunit 4 [Cordyceps militaris]AOR87419.1 NADH dehydrogenase subunit 4 [Cordyceps militaris]AOR87429.1 NADH dehydrogenase subunit 4 [Cordyceps militaris]QCX41987.1 NADH dehydrogenase subunit 4 [Cordyceps militaris]